MSDGNAAAVAQLLSAARWRPHVMVWAFTQLTGEDDAAMGDGNGGIDGGNYFYYSDNPNAADPV